MINIAKNKDEFLNSLFKPVDGKTYDGYIIRRTKTGVRLFMFGDEFHVNKHAVLCSTMKLPNGKTWYSYAPFHVTDRIGTYSECDTFCRNILKG